MNTTAFAVIAALAVAPIAHAHDSYLLPDGWDAAEGDAWTVEPGATARLHFTSAASFPALEYGPAADRIAWSEARSNAGASALAPGARDEDVSLALAFEADAPGVAVAALSLAPWDITLEAEEVAHYFNEIGADEDVRAAYAALGADAVLEETYTKHAKALLCVAPCTDLAAGYEPSGQALEFVEIPSGPPFARRFLLLEHGEPVAGRRVTLWTADGAHDALTTDISGAVAITELPEGATLLSAVRLRPPAEPGARFTSDFATITFKWNQ